ncbi:MAG TPA: plastocyanin/azurin family copper-binding protein [Gemmatimonadales bacterium]|nr:plastocyanin/azurin family copper-binding protein [Gemmatimonadales bacterium]
MALAISAGKVPLLAQGVTVTGQVTLLDKGDRPPSDVGQAVVWLIGDQASAGTPATVEIATEDKQFVPRLIVVARGSTVAFPNHDPFNHNVFSVSPEGPFDLGLYGRGTAKSVRFDRAGVIKVYCNVHASMRGLVVVQETSLSAQPGADGSFRMDGVPPGDYILHVWHERAPEVTTPLKVMERGMAPVAVTLDARGYRFVQHKDKNGRSYSDRSRRY